jgi:hypothetical protein
VRSHQVVLSLCSFISIHVLGFKLCDVVPVDARLQENLMPAKKKNGMFSSLFER